MAWLNWRHAARMQETAELAANTEGERDAWTRLELLIERVQSEQHGYRLTGEPAFLKRFENGLKSVEEQQRLLEPLITEAEQKANPAAPAVCWQVCFSPS